MVLISQEKKQPGRPSRWRELVGFAREFKGLSGRQWAKLIVTLVLFIIVILGLTYLAHKLFKLIPLPFNEGGAVWYLAVFITFLVTSLSLVIPVPVATPVLVAAALEANPVFIGLAAAVGSSIGEMGGYLIGRVSRSALIKENFMCRINDRFCNSRIKLDIQKYGFVAIGILAAQPLFPFDIAGLIGGSLKMNFPRFFGVLLAGRTVKYLLLAIAAAALGYLPFAR